jgi:hypothetical protein
MVLIRRFLVIAALMFWQGGFFFYASVVVPVGTDVFAHFYPLTSRGEEFSGKRQQGRITRTVARWINVAGAVALVPMGWDVVACTDAGRRRRWRGLLWLVAAALLGVLVTLYVQMDRQFDRDRLVLSEEGLFLVRHRLYLWVCAAQWGCCLMYLLLTLRAWRAQDARLPDLA